MEITLKDLARLANVSPSTVSRALAGHPSISETTRRKVKELARAHEYSPNHLARGLVTRRSNLIGLLVPDITNPFFSEWAQAAELEASKHGYAVILCNTMRRRAQEDQHIRMLHELRVTGLLTCSLDPTNPTIRDLSTASSPVVFCDPELPQGVAASLVRSDSVEGARLATQHLIALGRKRIAHLAGSEDSIATRQRVEGYKRALGEAGLPFLPNCVVSTEYSEAGGYESIQKLLDSEPEVDAVFAANDLIAVGAMLGAGLLGRRVPEDLAVVGFDDIRLASLVEPPLTSIRIHAREMGRTGMEILLDHLKHPDRPYAVVELEPTLIVRKSCGA